MLDAPIPLDEHDRLAALRRYCVLDTPAEPAFDRLTKVAQHILGVPTVLISLVDADRQWFKSRIGLDAEQTPRDISFCGHAVYQQKALIVPDASQDPRFADNPLVTGPLGLRFYAGTPLVTSDGFALGTLCAIDYVPRPAPSADQLDVLSKLADAVVAALELRRFAQRQTEQALLSGVLAQIAAAAHHAPHMQAALGPVLTALCAYSGFNFGHAFLRAGETGDSFASSSIWHVAPGPNAAALIGFAKATATVEADELVSMGLAGGKAQLIESLAAEPGRRAQQAAAAGLKSGLVFPVLAGGQVMAIVECHGAEASSASWTDLLALADYAALQLGRLAEREHTAWVKDEFVTTVSHELRTPLTSIAAALELLDDGKAGALPAKASTLIRIAHRNSTRLVSLINDILDIRKIESGCMDYQLVPHALTGLIERALIEMDPYAHGLGVRLIFNAPKDSNGAMAVVDGDRFIQVLTNLLSNAAKYSPRDQVVQVSLTRHKGLWRISVADQGPGIPPAFRVKMFQKFAQADSTKDKRHAGTGLGLAIVKKIVEACGGAVSFECGPGPGTVFHVDLPVLTCVAECPSP